MKKQTYDLEERLLEYSVRSEAASLFDFKSQPVQYHKTGQIVIPGLTRNPSLLRSTSHLDVVPAWHEILSLSQH